HIEFEGEVYAFDGGLVDYVQQLWSKGLLDQGSETHFVETDDGAYILHQYKDTGAPGFFVPYGITSVDVLVVGGGGGGGGGNGPSHGAGGGAGGVLQASGYDLTGYGDGGIAVVVGVGGPGQRLQPSTNAGRDGRSSQFGDLIAFGGG